MISLKKSVCNLCKTIDCKAEECKLKRIEDIKNNSLNYGNELIEKELLNTIIFNYSLWFSKVQNIRSIKSNGKYQS